MVRLNRGVLVMLDLDNTLSDRQAAMDAWVSEFSAHHQLPAGADR